MKSIVISLFVLISLAAFTQLKPKSHDECIEQVPGDWGPNFGDLWHEHEAQYWSCRLGISVTTVKAWQEAAHEEDMSQDILPVTVRGEQLVILEEVGGDAHCSTVKALKKVGSLWTEVWELPILRDSMDYCTFACPALKVSLSGGVLTISSPTSSDKNEDITKSCKHVSWSKERFLWNGTSFERVAKSTSRHD